MNFPSNKFKMMAFLVSREVMIRKLFCLFLMLITMSGCCELFGICTSVNVHTSISSPQTLASSNSLNLRQYAQAEF